MQILDLCRDTQYCILNVSSRFLLIKEIHYLWEQFLLKFSNMFDYNQMAKSHEQQVRSQPPTMNTPGLWLFSSSCQNQSALKASSYVSCDLFHILPLKCQKETVFKWLQSNRIELGCIRRILLKLQSERQMLFPFTIQLYLW